MIQQTTVTPIFLPGAHERHEEFIHLNKAYGNPQSETVKKQRGSPKNAASISVLLELSSGSPSLLFPIPILLSPILSLFVFIILLHVPAQ